MITKLSASMGLRPTLSDAAPIKLAATRNRISFTEAILPLSLPCSPIGAVSTALKRYGSRLPIRVISPIVKKDAPSKAFKWVRFTPGTSFQRTHEFPRDDFERPRGGEVDPALVVAVILMRSAS